MQYSLLYGVRFGIFLASPSSAVAASEDKACRRPHHVGWAAGGENDRRAVNWRELKLDVAPIGRPVR